MFEDQNPSHGSGQLVEPSANTTGVRQRFEQMGFQEIQALAEENKGAAGSSPDPGSGDELIG